MNNTKIKILLLGSGGFIGSQLRSFFIANNDYELICVTSNKTSCNESDYFIENFAQNYKNYEFVFKNVDVVINSIGLAHDVNNKELNHKYKKINTDAPINFYKIANKFGVKKFIHLSTILVYGNKNFNKPITLNQTCLPNSIYAKSKLECDNMLMHLKKSSKTNLCIIRLPLVLGKNPKGNLQSLLKYCNSNLPLPFKKINNIKSYITIKTLHDFIDFFISNTNSNNNIFLISENENISLEKLIFIYKKIFNKKNNLFYVPPLLLKILLTILFKKDLYYKIFNSSYYDTSTYSLIYKWNSRNNFEYNLKQTLNNKSKNL